MALRSVDGFEYHWPEPGEQLVAVDGGVTTACVNFSWDGGWEGYAEGYRRAAQCLVEHVDTTGRDQDFLVYPLVFLYRHAVELRMKQVIKLGGALLATGDDFEDIHDLRRLWGAASAVLEAIWPESNADHEAVRGLLTQLEDLDPDSYRFRYPVRPATKSRQPSLATDLRHIGLRNLSDRMEGLVGFFDAAVTGIHVYLDARDEDQYWSD